MKPALLTLKAALERLDKTPSFSSGHADARKALMVAANAAGFDPGRLVENWARYQIAVGEAQDQLTEFVGPEPESGELFG